MKNLFTVLAALMLLTLSICEPAAADPFGVIIAWGRNDDGQCNPPSPNEGFVAVQGGGFHSLALKDDGSVVA